MAQRANEAKLIVDARVPEEHLPLFADKPMILLQPEGNKQSNIEIALEYAKSHPHALSAFASNSQNDRCSMILLVCAVAKELEWLGPRAGVEVLYGRRRPGRRGVARFARACAKALRRRRQRRNRRRISRRRAGRRRRRRRRRIDGPEPRDGRSASRSRMAAS